MPPAARISDMHTCPMVTPGTPPIPHVGGPITMGCPTVQIGFMPAARVGDMATCVGPPDSIAKGSLGVTIGYMPAARMGDLTLHGGVISVGFPTVLIGEMGSFGPGIVLVGTPAEMAQLAAMLESIRNSGPLGAAFIHRLETAATPTRFQIGTSATDAAGNVIQLSNTGGGVTIRPTDSVSGDNEVYVDPTNLINYNGTDGNQHQETPEGLLLHEAGHADLLNSGDPAQTTGGPAAEGNVRTLTNPIRQEMGTVPEA